MEDDVIDRDLYDKIDRNNKKKEALDDMEKAARAIVAAATAATSASGAIPLPVVDMPVMIAEQVAMMASICAVYKIDIRKDGLKALVTTALGAGGAGLIGRTVATSLLKVIPFSTALASVISAGTAGVITMALGTAFIELCKLNKQGELSLDEMTGAKGKEKMKEEFKKNMKSKKE